MRRFLGLFAFLFFLSPLACIQEIPFLLQYPPSLEGQSTFQLQQSSLSLLCASKREGCSDTPLPPAAPPSLPRLNCREILGEIPISLFSHARAHDFLFFQADLKPCPTEATRPGLEPSTCTLTGRLSLLDICRRSSASHSFHLYPPDTLIALVASNPAFARIGHQASLLPDGKLFLWGGIAPASLASDSPSSAPDLSSISEAFFRPAMMASPSPVSFDPSDSNTSAFESSGLNVLPPARLFPASASTPQGVLAFGGAGPDGSFQDPFLITLSSPSSGAQGSSVSVLSTSALSSDSLTNFPNLWKRIGASAFSLPLASNPGTSSRLYFHAFGGIDPPPAATTPSPPSPEPLPGLPAPYNEEMIFHSSAYLPALKSFVVFGGLQPNPRPIPNDLAFFPQTKIFLLSLEGGASYISETRFSRVGHTLLPLPGLSSQGESQVLVLGGFDLQRLSRPLSLSDLYKTLFLQAPKVLLASPPLLLSFKPSTDPNSPHPAIRVEPVKLQTSNPALRYLFQRAFHSATLFSHSTPGKATQKALIFGGLRDLANPQRSLAAASAHFSPSEAFSLDLQTLQTKIQEASSSPDLFPQIEDAISPLPTHLFTSQGSDPASDSRHLFFHQATPLLTGQILISGGIEIQAPLNSTEPGIPTTEPLYSLSPRLWLFNPSLSP